MKPDVNPLAASKGLNYNRNDEPLTAKTCPASIVNLLKEALLEEKMFQKKLKIKQL